MTDAQFKELIETIGRNTSQTTCACAKDMATHEKHHEFVQEAIDFFAKLNKLKWDTTTSLMKVIALFLLMALLAGIALKFSSLLDFIHG